MVAQLTISRDEFTNAFRDYVRTFKFVTMADALKGYQNDSIKHVSIEDFVESEGGERFVLVAPIEAWTSFSAAVQSLTSNRVSLEGLDNAIQLWIRERGEFDLDEQVFADLGQYVFSWLLNTCQTIQTVYIRIYHIILGHDVVQISLGNTILHRSLPASKFTNDMDVSGARATGETAYLSLDVSGDRQTVIHAVKREVSHALAILRFVSEWLYKRGDMDVFPVNKAKYVGLERHLESRIICCPPDTEPETIELRNTDDELGYYFDRFTLDNADKFYGLSDINYHFTHQENTVSSLIIRALEFYDSGVQALTNWQTLYRYVVAVNTLVHPSRSKIDDILPRLKTLLNYGGDFTVDRSRTMDGVKHMTWNEYTSYIADPFKDFYVLRGRILHGDTINPTNYQIEDTRTIAHNVIRLTARLARELGWKSRKDVDDWFKSPNRVLKD